MAHVPAPHVRDPRLDPHLCYVRGESGVEAGTTWSASWSAWSADKPGHVWARRDPRTDPQPGDVNTGTAPEGHHAEVVTYTVVSRDDRALQVRTRNGVLCDMSLGLWSEMTENSYRTWTWTRAEDVVPDAPAETPAPDAPPDVSPAPAPWYAARGLPGCLGSLPEPSAGCLASLDLWRDLEALGYTPVGSDDSGRVHLGTDDASSASVWLRSDGRYAAMWADGHVFPPGGLGATMAAYENATWRETRAPKRDARFDPRPGDVMRATAKEPTTATQVMEWTVKGRLGDELLLTLLTDGKPAGSWDPEGEWKTVEWWARTAPYSTYAWVWETPAGV